MLGVVFDVVFICSVHMQCSYVVFICSVALFLLFD